ncbi:MAG: hypothetical protein AAF682_24170 [Planctomycetota bacterium]
MVIGLLWLFLGVAWWALAVGSLIYVGRRAPHGRRLPAVAGLAAAEGAFVWGTSFVPLIAIWVWTPMTFVAVFPFAVAYAFATG